MNNLIKQLYELIINSSNQHEPRLLLNLCQSMPFEAVAEYLTQLCDQNGNSDATFFIKAFANRLTTLLHYQETLDIGITYINQALSTEYADHVSEIMWHKEFIFPIVRTLNGTLRGADQIGNYATSCPSILVDECLERKDFSALLHIYNNGASKYLSEVLHNLLLMHDDSKDPYLAVIIQSIADNDNGQPLTHYFQLISAYIHNRVKTQDLPFFYNHEKSAMMAQELYDECFRAPFSVSAMMVVRNLLEQNQDWYAPFLRRAVSPVAYLENNKTSTPDKIQHLVEWIIKNGNFAQFTEILRHQEKSDLENVAKRKAQFAEIIVSITDNNYLMKYCSPEFKQKRLSYELTL